MFGTIFLHASIPNIHAGLCSGAKSLYSLKTLITSSFITTDSAIFSPPCTSRCPTAFISSRLSITL